MDLLIVLLVVGGVSVFFAHRAYRFLRGAVGTSRRNAESCSGGCPSCESCVESRDAGLDVNEQSALVRAAVARVSGDDPGVGRVLVDLDVKVGFCAQFLLEELEYEGVGAA